jgi:single-strand DNA-binding protein
MSRSLNKVMLIGNVGSDPEIRTTSGGTMVAKVSLATNRRFKDRSGEWQERTEWHRLNFWDRQAEIVEQYVSKGDQIYVEGRIEYSQTQDDKGNTRYWTDIRVFRMIMLGAGRGGPDMGEGSRAQGREQGRQAQDFQPSEPPLSEPDDDLPF